MAKTHKKQHSVPASYLQAWVDPDVAKGHEPYVHVFNKDGSSAGRTPPSKLFRETDLYTLTAPDGSRDLSREHALSRLEGDFARVRRDYLMPKLPLPVEAAAILFTFVAVLHSRTIPMRDHHQGRWKEVLAIMNEVEENMRTATPERRRAAASLGSLGSRDPRKTMSHEQVREVASKTMEHMLIPLTVAEVSFLPMMRAVILCADGVEPGFITSDTPVTWYDPESYKRPPLYRAPALGWPTLEISIPIAPSRMLCLTHPDEKVRGGETPLAPPVYVPVKAGAVGELTSISKASTRPLHLAAPCSR